MGVALLAWQPAIVTPGAIVILKHASIICVRFAGVRAWAAQVAIVVQALLSVPAGGCALGHPMAAAAVGGKRDWL